jgi:ACR3 family arsenite transporter
MAVTHERPRLAVAQAVDDSAVLKKLSTLDRFLPFWIGLAMAAGLGLGRLIPSLNDGLHKLQVGTVSLPIALGLLLMMYPVLAKVRYEELGHAQRDGVSNKLFFGTSLFLSWVVGPALMFALAWLLLPHQPAYRTGVIIVGLARCIAMVLIWNDLAKGDRDRTALLVVFNALFQVAAYSLLGYFYVKVLPRWLGLDTQGFEVGIWEVAKTVLIFLGIPLTAGFLTRRIGLKRKGREWYETKFIPRIGPITLYGLLFTKCSCSRSRARRSPPSRSTSPGSRCHCSSTSPSCGLQASRSAS